MPAGTRTGSTFPLTGIPNYGDGFWYEAWEGCNELVKLNLQNPEVRQYIFDSVRRLGAGL